LFYLIKKECFRSEENQNETNGANYKSLSFKFNENKETFMKFYNETILNEFNKANIENILNYDKKKFELNGDLFLNDSHDQSDDKSKQLDNVILEYAFKNIENPAIRNVS
jgi:hypothetical protein